MTRSVSVWFCAVPVHVLTGFSVCAGSSFFASHLGSYEDGNLIPPSLGRSHNLPNFNASSANHTSMSTPRRRAAPQALRVSSLVSPKGRSCALVAPGCREVSKVGIKQLAPIGDCNAWFSRNAAATTQQ